MFGHLMGKFYFRMDQEIQVTNKECIIEKQIPSIFLCLFLGICGVVFNTEELKCENKRQTLRIRAFVFYFHILVLQYFIKRESTFKILNIFHYYFYHFTTFCFK